MCQSVHSYYGNHLASQPVAARCSQCELPSFRTSQPVSLQGVARRCKELRVARRCKVNLWSELGFRLGLKVGIIHKCLVCVKSEPKCRVKMYLKQSKASDQTTPCFSGGNARTQNVAVNKNRNRY